MVDVEQRALRALEQHRLAARQRLVHDAPGVHRQRQQPRGETLEQGDVLRGVGALRIAQEAEHLVRLLDPRAHACRGAGEVLEVADANAATAVLVFIGGPDAPPRRADALALLARAIEQLVERQREMGAVRNVELALVLHAPARQRVQLGEERLGIEHHAVADDADRALEDAGGDLVQHELACARVDGVAGVSAALVAHDEVGALGEHVDHFALTLVTPLGAHDDNTVSLRSEQAPSNKKAPRGAGLSSEESYRRKLASQPPSTRATAPATWLTPSSVRRSARSLGRCTTAAVRQFPFITVTHSAAA